MTARRLDRTAAVLGIAMTLTLAVNAGAQLSDGQWRLSPQRSSGRTAVEVRPQPTLVVSQPGMTSMLFPSQPVAFNLVPAILMSDGTVFANFGFGFEPVLRSCSGVAVVGQSNVIGGNGVVLYQPKPPTYTQPVPNQQTASQQMVSAQRGGSVTVAGQAGQLACFGRSASGGFFAYRF
jgi:hypothetical protein